LRGIGVAQRHLNLIQVARPPDAAQHPAGHPGCQRAAVRQLVAAVPVPVPWPDIGAVALVCLLVAVEAGALATLRLTATPAIELAALRD
jgi:hypothetical protein